MKKILLILITILTFTNITTFASRNDNPTIKVFVANADEDYYLDVLINEVAEGQLSSYNNLDTLDQIKLNKIKNYDDDFSSSIIKGSARQFSGNVLGVYNGETILHSFNYDINSNTNSYSEAFQNRFKEIKLIIVSEDNQIEVSDIITLKEFDTAIYYDYQTNKYTLRSPNLNIMIFIIFALLITLIIDVALFISLGFNIAKNLKSFIVLNVIINGLISFIVSNAYYLDAYSFTIKNLYLLEIINFLIKIIFYPIILKSKKSFIFATLSSIISFVTTYLILLII